MANEVGKSHRLAGPLCIPRAIRGAIQPGQDLQAYDLIHLGGDDRDRTDDLSVANAALSQLSYVPMEQEIGLLPALPGKVNTLG